MALDNGTIQHPLPGDLQARVENALNLVTSLEAEQNRLSKLIGSMKGDVNALHEEKKSIENAIVELNKRITIANAEAIKAEAELSETISEITQKTANLRALQAVALEVSKTIENDKNTNIDRIKKVEQAEQDVNNRSAALAQKEALHEAKVKRLLDALK